MSGRLLLPPPPAVAVQPRPWVRRQGRDVSPPHAGADRRALRALRVRRPRAGPPPDRRRWRSRPGRGVPLCHRCHAVADAIRFDW